MSVSKKEDLQQEYDLLSHKIHQLRMNYITATDPAIRLKLQQEIAQEETDLQKFEKRFKEAEQQEELELPEKSRSESKRIPFINQEEKLDIIFRSSHTSSYHILDAPAGYGKTTLLKEFQHRFREEQFLCSYLPADVYQTLPNLVKTLFSEFHLGEPPGGKPSGVLVSELGNRLKNRWDKAHKGLVILIDLGNLGETQTLTLIDGLLTEFIPRLQRSLQTEELFHAKPSNFRVVIAGRYLTRLTQVKSPALPLRIHKLHLFSYDILLNLALQYLAHLENRSEIEYIAAHIMHLSGGHPGCMASLLKKYQEGCPPHDTFLKEYQEEIRRIISEETGRVRENIPEELRDIMDTLSPCRRFDYKFLRQFMTRGLIPNQDEIDLADQLTNAYLLIRKDGFLQDDVTRRLLAIRLYQDQPDRFITTCQQARDVYAEMLAQTTTTRPDIIAVELLYQELQADYFTLTSNTPSDREQLADRFLKQMECHLQTLIVPRNAYEMIENFTEALRDDPDFRFTLNYFLRSVTYNDEPYQRLIQRIDEFRQTLRKGDSHG